jgi:phenylalanyl-tRNA synthetase beta chain
MPKIEASLSDLLALAGLPDPNSLRELLEPLKGELDGIEGDTVKIELNDTNRPDLWTVEGVARGIRCWLRGAEKHLAAMEDRGLELLVQPGLEGVRPFIACFVSRGLSLGDRGLAALVNAQEKLCATLGRERRTAAAGIYRLADISFPVRYRPADPDTVFHPLGADRQMTLGETLSSTETGIRYAGILRDAPVFPFLEDSLGRPVSFPPVLNSEGTGRVTPEDSDLFCEVTGTDWHTVSLMATIFACALEDRGAVIEKVAVRYPDGNTVVTPVVHADTLAVQLHRINRTTGLDLQGGELPELLSRMDYPSVTVEDRRVTAVMAPYRRDGIHPADLVEDVAIAYGINRIDPILPGDYTLGRPSPESRLGAAVKLLLVGAGCEEIIRPVLASPAKISLQTLTPDPPVLISNPMTAEYSAVGNTVLHCLLEVESVSGHAAFPHRLFTLGEVLRRDGEGGLHTLWSLGVTTAGAGMDFGAAHSLLGVLAFGRGLELKLEPGDDPRFIPGRSASVFLNGRMAGVIGEIHPLVLEAWGIPVPVSAFEVDLEPLGG